MKKNALIIIIGFFLLIQPLSAQTWEASKRLTWTSDSSAAPAVATDSSNNIHLVYTEKLASVPQIIYKKSTDGGMTWTSTRLSWSGNLSYPPSITIDSGDNIHVVYADEVVSFAPDIFYKKSTDSGTGWTTKRLSWSPAGSYSPSISTDSNNNIYVVWIELVSSNFEIFFKRCTDGGATWTTKRLTWNSGGSYSPAIAVDSSDDIHIVWADDTPGNREIFHKKSTDGGSNWITKRFTWNSGYSYEPSIAADTNIVYVAWADNTPGNDEIFTKKSTDSGTSWKIKRLTWTPGDTSNPTINIDMTNNIHLAYIDDIPGNAEVYYKRSTNGGVNWTGKRLTFTTGHSYSPKMSVDLNYNIHTFWQNDTPGNYEIYYKKGIQ